MSMNSADQRPPAGALGGLGAETRRSRSTAFALAGLGGNNAHGAGFLAAAQQLQRQRQQAVRCSPHRQDPGPSTGTSTLHATRRARLVLPELEFISCTSGAIASTVTYLKGGDVREEMEGRVAAAERAGLLPRTAWTDPWRGLVTALFTGVPHVFGPWVQAYAQHWGKRLIDLLNPAGPRFGSVPTTLDEVLDLWFPARTVVPRLPRDFFVEAADVFTDPVHGVGVAFNSFDPNTGVEQLYVNDAALSRIADHHDRRADYGRTHRRTVYRPITPEAVRAALWLVGYGFPDGRLGPSHCVDGAYARSIILNELTSAGRVYAVKPTSERWIGRLPQNWFEVQDMQTEFWWEASYREQARLIETVNDLQAAGRLSGRTASANSGVDGGQIASTAPARLDTVRTKDYRPVELIPVEIGVQRGFLSYFVESREVFTEAYGRSLRLLSRRDEQDALEAGHAPPPELPGPAARPLHRP